MLSFLSKQQKTSTIYFKHCHLLRRNVTKFAQKPLPQTCVLSRSLLPTKHNVFFNKGLITQEPLLLMPGATRVQVSGLRCLTPAEYSLLQAQTLEGIAFREMILVLLTKVLYHAKDFDTLEGLRDNFFNIFKGIKNFKIPLEILKYMPEKRILVYLQHLTVFVYGKKKFSQTDLDFFCGSDISCSSFTEVNISSFIEVSLCRHIFAKKFSNPYLKFHLINPDALIPQFSNLESKEITDQKNSDFLIEHFLRCGKSYKIYVELKTYSHTGIRFSRFSVYHGNFKGSHIKEINNVTRGLERFIKENPSVEHIDLYKELLREIIEIKRSSGTLKEQVTLIQKVLFDVVFDPKYKALQISICVDTDLDSKFDVVFRDELSAFIEKEKHNTSILERVFPKDNDLPDTEEHKAIVDHYSEVLFTEELTTLIKNGLYKLQDV